MSIAIISSLYRCERHLPAFRAAVLSFAQEVSQRGISVHYLPIVNDASREERAQIDQLTREINSRQLGVMAAHYVPRETLYASWNRGLALAREAYFACWNADDLRSPAAFIEGYRALQAGANLVDFPFVRRRQSESFSLLPRRQREVEVPCLFNPDRFSRGDGLGPFFLASRALYDQAGQFDPHFQIAGDTDWASRALPHVKFHRGRQSGGEFLVHGDNLSNTGSEREDIEVNIIFMRRGDWQQLRPANPSALRAAWETWGNPAGISLPAEEADFLWGPAAEARWRAYQRERRQPRLLRRLRLALAARGLLQSLEWQMARRGKSPP